MRRSTCAALLAAVALVSACGDKKEAADKAAAGPVNMSAPVPDVGKVTTVKVTAEGFGASASEAVAEAMKMAILQVNGASIQTASMTAKYGLDVTLGKDSASLRANEFAEVVKQRSGGVIQNFKILDLQEPSLLAGKRYKASIEAEIAKFNASAEMQKIKVVVGPIRFESASLPMGDRSLPSAEIGMTLRQRISDALVQTGRFAVLDREFSPEIEQELEMIATGQAPSAELAKMSQAASADMVWSARVSNLAYSRHARQLKTSDRELVSYSGGWAMSQKLVNVASRQVMSSDSLRGQAPSLAPTTLGSGVDSAKALEDMSNEIVRQVVASILRRTFPVTVVSLDGTNVVLSQGGQAIKEGTRYAMVTMGNEMKDPQTGQSLGRVESPCCELVVERVTPNLSYGRLENVRANLDQLSPGGLQLRQELAAGSKNTAGMTPFQEATVPAFAGASVASPGKPVNAVKPRTTNAAVPAAPAQGTSSKADDKW
ncbi:CsgG/HfaB family protein [Polaromonas sp. SM01]|uniref:CsgG/HfaB family protein n=1 Tax=Polaromonas sp. SM01 TaxID=3085630 RepID=UPI002982AE0C|nr:CsgG/HfaB family protein [Polaromonas sp. SM01]MDW5444220.1 CsgG/HfaB family protein [Polaromonas sp. SM01]